MSRIDFGRRKPGQIFTGWTYCPNCTSSYKTGRCPTCHPTIRPAPSSHVLAKDIQQKAAEAFAADFPDPQ